MLLLLSSVQILLPPNLGEISIMNGSLSLVTITSELIKQDFSFSSLQMVVIDGTINDSSSEKSSLKYTDSCLYGGFEMYFENMPMQ